MKELLGRIGRFWTPKNPDRHVLGILTTNSRNQIQLNIEMPYSLRKSNNKLKYDDWEYSNHEIILGEINTVSITLYGCFKEVNTITTININSKVNDKIIYSISHVFNNYHFESKDDFKCESIILQYENLEEWFARTGFTMESFTDLFYIIPPEIKAKLNDFDLNISANCFNRENTNIKVLEEVVSIQIVPKTKNNYFDLEKYIFLIRDFLIELAPVNRNSPLTSEIFNNNLINDYKYNNRILRHDMFFTLEDIKKNFTKVIDNWFKKHEDLESFYYLYFINLSNVNKYSEGTLIAFTQALETYLRKTQKKDKYLPDTEYEIIFENMEKCLSEQKISNSHKQSLRSRIKYGNEYSLRKRLLELLNKTIKFDIIKKITNNKIDRFVNEIVDTRNYYTHYSEELEKNAKKDKDLLILNEKLKILIEFCFLIELGLDDDEIEKITKKYFLYKKFTDENCL